MERAISGSMGKGSVNHNTRAFKAKNVDPERSIQMFGEAVNSVDLFSLFVKAVYDISEKTAVGSKDAIGHIGSKLFIRFRKLFRNFAGKR